MQPLPKKLKYLLIAWMVMLGACFIMITIALYSYIGYISANFLDIQKQYGSIFLVQSIFALIAYLLLAFESRMVWDMWKGRNTSFWMKVFAILGLLSIPVGTALGIATLMILNSKEVHTYFFTTPTPVPSE